MRLLLAMFALLLGLCTGCGQQQPSVSKPVVVAIPSVKPVEAKPKFHCRLFAIHKFARKIAVGMKMKTVHRRLGKPDETVSTPLPTENWPAWHNSLDLTETYTYQDGTLFVTYVQNEDGEPRVIGYAGQDFVVGRLGAEN